ncbi:CS-domain-containing protein [Fistulina hepatica ATCC 64428]|nr:CS-domain-containing protein [Fistulina hepatica ATCC 64428]
MPVCTRKGCLKEFSEDNDGPCVYHPGPPLFHEGLKSYTCCNDVYKPVLGFDDFMKIPGCTTVDKHTTEAQTYGEPAKPAPPTSATSAPQTTVANPFTAPSAVPPAQSIGSQPMKQAPPPVIEEEDDLDVAVEVGKLCRHKGCGIAFVSDEVNRIGDGAGTVCIYHSMPQGRLVYSFIPTFITSVQGYLCCKRRVLEFEEFLKIEGCKIGRHVFVPKKSADAPAEQLTECRVDHYQTVDKVHVSIFAKKANQETSKITFEDEKLNIDVVLPGPKRFKKSIELFGPIDPSQSSYKFFGTKVEVVLQKADTRSWTLLEKTDHDLGNIQLTFGVSGRTGTVGAKEIIS